MMKKYNIRVFVSLFIFVVLNPFALGADLNLTPNAIDFRTPEDSVRDFTLLTGGWDAEGQQQFCSSSTPVFKKGVIVSTSIATNYTTTIAGTEYRIFATNTPSVGWIMGARDTNNPTWTPLTNQETTVFPFPNGTVNTAMTLGALVQFAFVKLPGSLETGSNLFNTQKIADFKCYGDTTGTNLIQSGAIYVQGTSIDVVALSCQVESPSSVSIPLGEHLTTNLPNVNENFGSYSTAVELKCDSDIIPWMTITDASDASNTTNKLTLTSDSTAKGVSVQVFYDNVAKAFGPDSSARGNTNQFSIGNKTTMGQIVTVPLNFKYIRTEESVTPGTANAAATVTFSYQ